MSAYRIDVLPFPCSRPLPSPHSYYIKAEGMKKAMRAVRRVMGAPIAPYALSKDSAEGYAGDRIVSIVKEL